MSQTNIKFEEDPPRQARQPGAEDALLLNIDGYEGPIDVLLDLARRQKVDLAKLSILQLVRQYLAFVEEAKSRNLTLAAEYLVMAAWLAYLKSRLLLPDHQEDDEPSAEEMAEALQFQLRRLEAMQKAADKLMGRPQLGQQIFTRGMPEGLKRTTQADWDVALYEILKAYGDIARRKDASNYDLPVYHLMSTQDAFARLKRMLGNLPRKGAHSVWATLDSFLPDDLSDEDKIYGRSTLATTLTAGLEMAKQGQLEIRQDGLFRPIYLRGVKAEEQDQS